MSNNKSLSVAGIGFSEHDERILKSVMRLSTSRPRSYSLIDIDKQEVADILLVNGDNPDTLERWKAFSARRPEAPTVLVATAPPSNAQYYHVGRPIVASRLIRVLDQVTVQERKLAPEAVNSKENKQQEGRKHTSDTRNNYKPGEALMQRREASIKPRYRALVVDDSETVRKLIDLQLRMLGIQADLAETAQDSFSFLRANTYDIILLDVMLPDSPGFQICKAIKKDPAKKRIPVIMLTGKSSPLDRVKGKFSGCDCYLTKPVDQDTFLKTVAKYLPVDQAKPRTHGGSLTPLYQ